MRQNVEFNIERIRALVRHKKYTNYLVVNGKKGFGDTHKGST